MTNIKGVSGRNIRARSKSTSATETKTVTANAPTTRCNRETRAIKHLAPIPHPPRLITWKKAKRLNFARLCRGSTFQDLLRNSTIVPECRNPVEVVH